MSQSDPGGRIHSAQPCKSLRKSPACSWCTPHQMCLFRSLRLWGLPMQRLLLGLWVIAINITLVTSGDPWNEVWIIPGILTNSNIVPLLLRSQETAKMHVAVVTKTCLTQALIKIKQWHLNDFLTKIIACFATCTLLCSAPSAQNGNHLISNFLTAPCFCCQDVIII